MGSGFAKKKKQAKAMQSQLMQMQEQMQNTTFTGTAGNGLVTITLSGDYDVKKISIKPECVDPEDVEGLELLVSAAFKDAAKQVQEKSMPSMPGIGSLGGMAGLPPGLADMF